MAQKKISKPIRKKGTAAIQSKQTLPLKKTASPEFRDTCSSALVHPPKGDVLHHALWHISQNMQSTMHLFQNYSMNCNALNKSIWNCYANYYTKLLGARTVGEVASLKLALLEDLRDAAKNSSMANVKNISDYYNKIFILNTKAC